MLPGRTEEMLETNSVLIKSGATCRSLWMTRIPPLGSLLVYAVAVSLMIRHELTNGLQIWEPILGPLSEDACLRRWSPEICDKCFGNRQNITRSPMYDVRIQWRHNRINASIVTSHIYYNVIFSHWNLVLKSQEPLSKCLCPRGLIISWKLLHRSSTLTRSTKSINKWKIKTVNIRLWKIKC